LALGTAHEGYEYQDYLTVGYVIQEIIGGTKSVFLIDKKDTEHDKFDDLKIIDGLMAKCIQVKYSNEDVAHKLSRYDLSNGNGHDTALDTLFFSWKELKEKYGDVTFKLCVAWDLPDQTDDILDVLQEEVHVNAFSNKHYKILPDKIWPKGKKPKSGWNRFSKASSGIDREEFILFCENFSIEVNYPKASLDLDSPGELENILFDFAKKLGVGIYPNNISIKDFIYRFVSYVKSIRAKGGRTTVEDIIQKVGLITNYGKIEHNFQIDEGLFVREPEQIDRVLACLKHNNKIIFTGEPGAGKSWFIEDFVRELKRRKKKVIRFNCYLSLDDSNSLRRIRRDVFYGNLMHEILAEFPELMEFKESTYGANKEEVENLFKHINQECYLIVDGLDHIERVYEAKKGNIEKGKTDIIDSIYHLVLSANIRVLLSSQPLSIYETFYENGFYPLKINDWGKDQTSLYLEKCNIKNEIWASGIDVLTTIQEKSNGNALYISYLVKEIKKMAIFQEDKFRELPQYSIGLKEYYHYLFVQVSFDAILYSLAGLEFYVTNEELKEITGLGDNVDTVLENISPVLRTNVISGGIIIYHESFRRFIVDYLSEKGGDVKKIIYRDIIEWLDRDGLFGKPKSFHNLLEILVSIEEYSKVMAYLNINYVHDSMYFGYSRESILKNYRYFLKSACLVKEFSKIALLSEIGNMLDLTMYEIESINEDYMEALAAIHGIERLNSILEFDGKATYGLKEGLEACYICSKRRRNTWWNLYWENKEQISLDEMKYYVRYVVDKNGIDIIDDILKKMNKKGYSNFRKLIFSEIITYITVDEVAYKIEKYNLKQWKETYDEANDWLYGQKYVAEQKCLDLLERIRNIGHIGEDDSSLLMAFFKSIGKAIRNNKYRIYLKALKDFADINWFYNWCIFVLEMIEMSEKVRQGNCEYSEEKIIEIYQQLLKDTDVFKGKPSTCDLYGASELIKESMLKPLKYISTKQAWKQIIDILFTISQETTTSLDSSLVGPLPDYKLMEILMDILAENNSEYVMEVVRKIIASAKEGGVYGTISSFCYKAASMEMKIGNLDSANEYYKEGIKYSLCYSSHKEASLEQVIDSYPLFYNIKTEKAIEYRNKITDMTLAVLSHTDGRVTKRFLNRWFRQLLMTDTNYAVNFLSEIQLRWERSWIVEEMIEDLIEWMVSNGCSFQAIYLIEALPNSMNNSIIQYSVKAIRELMKCGKEKDARRLYINIISRLNFKYMHRETGIDMESLIELSAIGDQFGINVKTLNAWLLKWRSISVKAKWETRKTLQISTIPVFSSMSFDNMFEWLSNNIVTEDIINAVIYWLEENNLLEEKQIMQLICAMVHAEPFSYNYDKHLDYIKIILENAGLNEKIKAYGYVLIFTASKSKWNQNLYDKESFSKAITYDRVTALDTLFDELYIEMAKLGVTITTNLMAALMEIQYDNEIISEMWCNTYDVMQMRLPDEAKHDLEIKNEHSLDIGLSCVILGRLIHGEKERMLSSISYLIDSLDSHQDERTIIPVKWFLRNFERFNYISQLAVLQSILHGMELYGKEYVLNFKSELEELYGHKDMMIDLIISNMIEIEEENVSYELMVEDFAEENITVGQRQAWVYFNKQLQLLHDVDLDYTDVIRICCSKENMEKERGFFDNYCKTRVKNTVGKSILLKNIIGKLYEIYGKQYFIESLCGDMLIDFKLLCYYKRARSIIPNHNFYQCNEEGKIEILNDIEEDFISIAFHETRRTLAYNETKESEIYRALVKAKADGVPVNENVRIGFTDYVDENQNALIIMTKNQDDFEDEIFLWPNDEIFNLFITKIIFDSEQMEFVGYDCDDNIVIRFHTWRGEYYGNNEFSNKEIPLVEGEELLMSAEYVKKLVKSYGKLYIQTNVKNRQY
jgi:broad-specificity NMP kinase